MTDSTSEIRPTAPATETPATPASSSSPRASGIARKKKRNGWLAAFIVVVLIAAALAGAVWYQQHAFGRATALLSEQTRDSAAAASQASAEAQRAISVAQAQAARLGAMQESLQDAQAHIRVLRHAFQRLTDSGSDRALVNDIDHMVTIADQQLTLNGNVANAVAALEAAQARLARANRPALAPLQQAINGDLEHLRGTSVVDVAAVSAKLRQLDTLIGHAALLVPDAAAPALALQAPARAEPRPAPESAASGEPAWRRTWGAAKAWLRSAWSSTRDELARLVSVRRVSDPEALLMSPDQAVQLRENLHLRVMTAQLALMMRQQAVWQSETRTLEQALRTRYDTNDPLTREALELAAGLARTVVDVKPPSVRNSLAAITALRDEASKRDHARSSSPGGVAEPAASASTGAVSAAPRPHETTSSALAAPHARAGMSSSGGAAATATSGFLGGGATGSASPAPAPDASSRPLE